MDKNRLSRDSRAGAGAPAGRRFSWARPRVLAASLALILAGLNTSAYAQSCIQQCQQDYVTCLREGHGAVCDDTYDSCLAACM